MQQTLRETEEKLEGVMAERDSLLIDKHFLQEVVKNQMADIEILKACCNHWKNSYYDIHNIIGEILDFYTRWKGIPQERKAEKERGRGERR
jgi:hypothetical protein